MKSLRFKALDEACSRKPQGYKYPQESASALFGKYVFSRDVMKRYVSREVFDALIETVDHGKPLSRDIANGVAAGMQQWAIEMGARHYTHWFKPLTGVTAEQHASFVALMGVGGV